MKSKRSKASNNFNWIIIVALLILLYSSYFLLYIPKQEMLVKERGFRILEEYAENIHKKKEYYQTHIKNYGVYYAVREFEDTVLKEIAIGPDSLDVDEIQKVVDELDKNIIVNGSHRNTQSSIQQLTEINSTTFDGIIKTSGGKIAIEPLKQPQITRKIEKAEISHTKRTLNFNLKHTSYQQYFTNAIDSIEIESDTKKALKNIDEIQIPFEIAMENLKFDQLFKNIAFLDSTGVIHNSNRSVIDDITNLKMLLNDTLSKTQGGVLQKLEIKGVKTHVLILPITFLDQEFYLAGFIPDTEYRGKTRTINSQLLTIISGIILLLLIGMPILKIVFISRKERLNVRDAHNATISLILGTSLLILLFIGTMKYYVVDRESSSKRIEEISDKLTAIVEKDFDSLFILVDSILKDSPLLWKNNNLRKEYVYNDSIYSSLFPFNEILLMNSDGKVIRAVTKTAFSNLVELDLSNRNYFKNIKDSMLSWPIKGDLKKHVSSYYIESIKSYNTGYNETAISFRLKQPLLKERLEYLAVTSHIPSLYDQVLPADIAFVVIDKNGDVLYHSIESKNLQENFLVETNYHPKILGGIKFRQQAKARITYNERRWLARVVPLKGKPLYHVTLIDLRYADDKNSRIYLFTFYFILFTFICIVIGMQIIQRIGASKRFMKSKTWSYKWLLYRRDKQQEYSSLLATQSVILVYQVIGIFTIQSPVIMLFYQLIFIAFPGVAAYIVLFKKSTFHTVLSLLVVILIGVGILLWLNEPNWYVAIFVLITIVIVGIWNFRLSGNQFFFRCLTPLQTYLAYMLVWLSCLAIVPVISYYLSVRYQEEVLTQKNKMIHMANENILLQHEHKAEPQLKEWLNRINGSKLDGLGLDTILFDSIWNNKLDSLTFSDKHKNADRLYSQLPSPVTKDDYLMSLLSQKNKTSDWVFADSLWVFADSRRIDSVRYDSLLVYANTEYDGVVAISSAHLKKLQAQKHLRNVVRSGLGWWQWILSFAIPILLLGFLIWRTFLYLSGIILGTIVAKWKWPNTPNWKDLILQNNFQQILIICFNNKQYYLQSQAALNTSNTNQVQVKQITAKELFDEKTSITKLISSKQTVFWLSGLGAYLLNYKQADFMLKRLNELEQNVRRKLIIDMPYDTDFIKEYFEDQVTDFEMENEEEIKIDKYLNGLRYYFRNYYRFTGSIDKKSIENNLKQLHPKLNDQIEKEEQILADAHLMKLQYGHVWDKLSRMEKMLLFDLADDGMLNFKNRFLINRLKMKGLIELEPYAKFFTPSFQYFLKYSITQEETLMLEHKLIKQGKWKNTRYLILLLLIPLAAFMFISQGTSIEKVVGILTGVLALFSGAVRLMGSGLLSGLSKQ